MFDGIKFVVVKYDTRHSFMVGGLPNNTIGIVLFTNSNFDKCNRIKDKLRTKSRDTDNALYFVHTYVDGYSASCLDCLFDPVKIAQRRHTMQQPENKWNQFAWIEQTIQAKGMGFYHQETGDAWHLECAKKWSLNPKSTRIVLHTREEASNHTCIECHKPIAPEKPEIKMSNRHIAIGSGSGNTEEAIKWLKGHGCKVDSALGVTIVQLTEAATLGSAAYHWQYTINFPGEDGEYEDQFAIVEFDVDCSWTTLRLDNRNS